MTTLEPRTTLSDVRRIALPQAPAPNETNDSSIKLLTAVQAAVRSVPSGTLRPVCSREAGLAFQPRSLLALLSYSYASGIYSSEDIEETMCRDAEFRRLCGGEFPGPKTLKAFRRNNRAILEECLGAVLRALDGSCGRTHESTAMAEAHDRLQTAVAMDMG